MSRVLSRRLIWASIGTALCGLCGMLMGERLASDYPDDKPPGVAIILLISASGLLIVAGILAAAVTWFWFMFHGRPTPECCSCGYNLTGLTTPRCPECGEPFDESLLAPKRPPD